MTRIKYGYSREVRVMCLGEREYPTEKLNRPELVCDYWWQHIVKSSWYDRDKEMFVVIALNRQNYPIAFSLVSLGTATSSLAHPREVFRPAVAMGAVSVFVCHNHPSGDPAPSACDVTVTRQLKAAGDALDIELLDHVIIGDTAVDPRKKGYYSFSESGVIPRRPPDAPRPAQNVIAFPKKSPKP